MAGPYRASWGSGREDIDWNTGASKYGNAVLSGCPRLLIFVQGIADPGQWGENLSGARHYPVKLMDRRKLVYSPHVFGPSYFGGIPSHLPPSYRSPDFPANLPAEWDALWGYLAGEGMAPTVVGGFGGICEGRDEIWHAEFLRYLIDQGVSGIFYSGLDPDNPAIGGLLLSDWLKPNQAKLDVLRQFPATPIQFSPAHSLEGSRPQQITPRYEDAHTFCKTLTQQRNLRSEVPPRFCYHLNELGNLECERHYISKDDGLLYPCIYMTPERRCVAADSGTVCNPASALPPNMDVSRNPQLPLAHTDYTLGSEPLNEKGLTTSAAQPNWSIVWGLGVLASVVLAFAALGIVSTFGELRAWNRSKESSLLDHSDDELGPESGQSAKSVIDEEELSGQFDAANRGPPTYLSMNSNRNTLSPTEVQQEKELSELVAIVEDGSSGKRSLRPDELQAIRGLPSTRTR